MEYSEIVTQNKSIDQCFMYQTFSSLSLTGPVLDLGGGNHFGYHRYLPTSLDDTVCANLPRANHIDVAVDVRAPLPFRDDHFSTVLCLNLVEHVLEPQHVIDEGLRVLQDGGQLVLAVPFLHRIHADPNDFTRYTEQHLRHLCRDFDTVEVIAHDRGPVSAASKMMVPLNKIPLLRFVTWRMANAVDTIFDEMGLYSDETTEKYPLFYVVIAAT